MPIIENKDIYFGGSVKSFNEDVLSKNNEDKNLEKSKISRERFYVIPYRKEWAIRVRGQITIEKKYSTKEEAVKQAREETKKTQGLLIIKKKNGKVERKISYHFLKFQVK